MSRLKQQLANKNLGRLLNSPEGRAALSDKFNTKVETVEEETEKTVVAILMPCRESAKPQTQFAVPQMILEARNAGVEVFVGPPVHGSSIVSWTRNWLMADLLKTGKHWTHVLYIDDDIVPKPGDLLRLLSHKKDIVAGVCTRRQDPPLPNIRFWREETLSFEEILEWPENATIEIGGAGTGMILITRHALELVANAWMQCLYEKEFWEPSEQMIALRQKQRTEFFDKNANAYWFRLLESLSGKGEQGEDISFSFMARRYCGLKIFADTSVQPDHIGTYGYGIKDYLPYRAEVVAKAKAQGIYEGPQIEKPQGQSQISIILPTRGRPENIRKLVGSIKETSHKMPEIVLYIDDDDAQSKAVADELKLVTCVGPRQTLSNCWNDALSLATRDIVMMGGDDLIFKTAGWDALVEQAFENSEDKLIFVHGHDGHWGRDFGTHGFLHRKWIETVGYFTPKHFSSDYGDTWINDIANDLGRRVYLPFITEHMHPAWGKAAIDKTHEERIERGHQDDVTELYKSLQPDREADADKLRAAMKKKAISILIPARGNPEGLKKSVESLLNKAKSPNQIEILVRIDADEPSAIQAKHVKVITGQRYGYKNLHRYYNELAHVATGEWLMLWNDDAVMETQDWDVQIKKQPSGMSTLNFTGEFNTFPAIHRSLYEVLGHISQQAHCDTWIQQIGRQAEIERYVPLKITHLSREEKGRGYETREDFYSTFNQKKVGQDIEKVMSAKGAVLVG